MENRKYIPKTTNKVVSTMNCFWCNHRNKCINSYRFESKFCLSFQKSAGIKKKIRKRNKGE